LSSPHRPVLVSEVVELLAGKGTVIDATVGAGGHAEALLQSGVGSVLGLDRDESALRVAETRLARFGARFRGILARFSLIGQVARRVGLTDAGGVLFDLGVSSMQLDDPTRGFAYRSEGTLDMRMGPGEIDRPSAKDVVNSYSEDELVRVIGQLGEERMARRIARAIIRSRNRAPISTTQELAAVVAGAVPRRRGGPHPARRTFQGLRIEVNAELEELAAALPPAAMLLAPAGRLVIISYHSLEDRIVKRFISSEETLTSLTRKVVRPRAEEAAGNPRSRSARLRAAERVPAA
jgi:16S rRNA (cytosine1402-N4)-methyltransferase